MNFLTMHREGGRVMPFTQIHRAGIVASILAFGLFAGVASGAETKTIKIAYEGALTGPVAFFGVPIGNAVQLAVDGSKEELAKAGVDLQYVPADDQVDAAQAPAVARKMIQDSALIGVVGPILAVRRMRSVRSIQRRTFPC